MEAAIVWRCLNDVGHDACRLIRKGDAWRLEGATAFRKKGVPACLRYQVDGDSGWNSREGVVQGWIGERTLDYRISRRHDGAWMLNGRMAPVSKECMDLDLGFTPSTNLFQLRRIALKVGQAADVPVAWFDVFAGTLDTLRQRYERRSAQEYWYEAPRFSYSALFQVSKEGFVLKYPDLWEAEP